MTTAPDGDWSSYVRGRLFEQRVVFLRGDLDEELAGRVVAELMTLDATGDDAVALHVDSGGGPLEAAFSVMDTIDLLGVPVEATCVGRAEGSAVGVVAVAHRRRAAPHARFRLAEPKGSVSGSASDLERWAAHWTEQVQRFAARLAAATRRPQEHVEADLQVGRWLDAGAAQGYGLVDEVLAGRVARGEAEEPRRPFGFSPPRD